jgi:hypothetical protein
MKIGQKTSKKDEKPQKTMKNPKKDGGYTKQYINSYT